MAEGFIFSGRLNLSGKGKNVAASVFAKAFRQDPPASLEHQGLENLAPAMARSEQLTHRLISEVKAFAVPQTGVLPTEVLRAPLKKVEARLKQDQITNKVFESAKREFSSYSKIIDAFSSVSGKDDFDAVMDDVNRLIEHAEKSDNARTIKTSVQLGAMKFNANEYVEKATYFDQIQLLINSDTALRAVSLGYFEHAVLIDVKKLNAINDFVKDWENLVKILQGSIVSDTGSIDDAVGAAMRESIAVSEKVDNFISALSGDPK